MSDTSHKHSVSLQFNCGYARCAIRELTPRSQKVDKQKRASDFQDLFKDCPHYGISQSYFKDNSGRPSLFNRHCDKIIRSWSKKWHPAEQRKKYESSFSISAWKTLSTVGQQKHTLACCQECCKKHEELQLGFPLKPNYKSESMPRKRESHQGSFN